nr:hypothetical protein RCYEFQYI_RCYEFQYI_CDS_0006 [Microvirus sp.]
MRKYLNVNNVFRCKYNKIFRIIGIILTIVGYILTEFNMKLNVEIANRELKCIN